MSDNNQVEKLKKSKEVLESIKELFTQDKNQNQECISLYDVSTSIRRYYQEYKKLIKECNNILEKIIANNGRTFKVNISRFDNDGLNVLFHPLYDSKKINDFMAITLSKEDSDLYISKIRIIGKDDIVTVSDYDKEQCYKMFYLLSDTLSSFYDQFKEFKELGEYKHKSYESFMINTVNSNFSVEINSNKISIGYFESDFRLSFSMGYEPLYSLNANSSTVINNIKGQENEIFKRIYVNINQCPKWIRAILYQIREEQLESEQILEEKKQKKECRNQKIRNLYRRLISKNNYKY